jgi:hypothetical protein
MRLIIIGFLNLTCGWIVKWHEIRQPSRNNISEKYLQNEIIFYNEIMNTADNGFSKYFSISDTK